MKLKWSDFEDAIHFRAALAAGCDAIITRLNASDDPTYQVMAVEVFYPREDGTASGRVWDGEGQ